ncbi:hypothetical protein TrCOL_g5187 [Triparma columacea]|uniref:Uncharacterized protein n=1 Tax=Triparma columacea TaxID=722753 RepID=A0A9W7G1C2_9STRA|nr:hypothetical protein TrCOL_g5187 [Triparma columacea]
MFTSISAYYDIINTLFTFKLDQKWRLHLLSSTLPPDTPSPVHFMDIATGTCEVVKTYLTTDPRLIRRPSKIVAVDPSVGMLNVCHDKLVNFLALPSPLSPAPFPGVESVSLISPSCPVSGSSHYPPISLHLKSATDFTFVSSSSPSSVEGVVAGEAPVVAPPTITHATVAFGIRNVPDRGAAMCNIWRHMVKSVGEGGSTSAGGGEAGRLGVLEVSYTPTWPRDFPLTVLPKMSTSSPLQSLSSLLTFTVRVLVSSFIHYVVPSVGWAVSGGGREYKHLVDSLEEFPEIWEEEVEGLNCEGGEGGVKGGWKTDTVEKMNFGSIKVYVFEAYAL